MVLYPVTDAIDGGMLDVGDGHRVCWEAAGTRTGKPALILHGGPGSGSAAGARRLAGIPIFMVHGRLDLSSPLDTPWRLARELPDAELMVLGAAGHGVGRSMSERIRERSDRYASRR